MHPGLYFALSDRLSVYCEYWTAKRDALYTYTVTVYSARLTKRGLALYTFMIVCEFRVYDSKARRYAEDITEQNRIVRTGKFEVEVTNNKKQEAQLSQRDRATFGVIEYFATSLKVTHGHSK